MATDSEARAAGFVTPAGSDLVSEGDNAISQNARVALDLYNQARWWRTTITATTPLDAVTTPGGYPMQGAATAASVGIPVPSSTPGWLEVSNGYSDNYLIQEFRSADGTIHMQRHKWAGTWKPWQPKTPTRMGTLSATSNIDAMDMPPGDWQIPSNTVGQALGLPGRGVLTRKFMAANHYVDVFFHLGGSALRRDCIGTVWRAWGPFAGGAPVANTGTEWGLRHALLEQDFRRRIGPVGTGGKAAIALRFDHGLTNFSQKILPLLRARNLPATVAMNARTWDVAENSAVTPAVADSWADVEFANHSATHKDAADYGTQYDEIVTGLEELKAQLPNHQIDGWIMPGVASSDQYGGMGIGYQATNFADYSAGRLMLGSHAWATGYNLATKNWVLDGEIKQGQYFYEYETKTVQQTKNEIDANITAGKGLALMMHPRNLDLPNLISTAMLTEILDYIVAKRDAGQLVVLPLGHMTLADKHAHPLDTGWRRIALPTGASGTLLARRAGDTVHVQAANINGLSGSNTVATLPTGMRPKISTYSPLTGSAALQVTTGGALQINTATATSYHVGGLSFLADHQAFPAAANYPGTTES